MIIGIVVMAILMTMSAVVWGYTTIQLKGSRQAVAEAQALHIAEAGLDKAINGLNANSSFTGESSVTLSEGSYTTTVSTIDPSNKQITSTGYVPNAVNPKATVTIKGNVSIDVGSVAFNFGVQVGVGGLQMDNNSQVFGNVYSNGDITGGPAGSGLITGDATVAGGGSPTADLTCETNNSNFAFDQNDRRDVAMKFTPGTSGALTRVSVYLRKAGSPGDINVRIVTNQANLPSQTQVGGTGTINSSTVTGSYGWVDASFSSSPILSSSTAYWLILDSSSSASNYYTWAHDSTDSSCSGTGVYTANWNSNPTWGALNGDFNFRTYMGGVATKLTDVTVNGHARANKLESCIIGGDAYYESINTCTVTGVTNPSTADSAPQAMPISQSQIDGWKSAAAGGGSTPGPYTITGTVTMGPQKIVGDLTIDGTLFLTGPIWVEGDLVLTNNSIVRVDASLGNAGTVILADDPNDPSNSGLATIDNNAVIEGNNNPGSYPMIVTTKSGTAMYISNNASGAIFYAANGTIEVSNNAGGAQITGYGVHLNENSTITYVTGLSSTTFANGPGGAWALVRGTYVISE